MKTSKLFRLHQILTPQEFTALGLWLESPWANTNKKLVTLYSQLQDPVSTLVKNDFDKALLFKKLYPGKSYDDKMMRNLMAAMCKQVEKFLAHQRFEKDQHQARHLLAKEYLERHEYDWYKKQVDEIIDTLEAKKVKDTADYLQLSILHEELYKSQEFAHLTASNDVLTTADRYLDSYYCVQKWRHLTELNERKMVYPERFHQTYLLESLENLAKPLDIFVIHALKQKMALSNDLSLEGYRALSMAVFSNFNQLAVQDQQVFLHYLINATIQLWLKGNVHIMPELLELYKKGLETELLFFHGRLSEKTFSNIVTTSNSLDQFDYAHEFIEKYGDRLARDIQEDASTWAIAHTLFKQGDFETCISNLSTHRFSSDHFSLLSKVLLMQAYFEAFKKKSSYLSFALDFAEAMKKYVYRTKVLSADRKTAYLNFVKYAVILLKKLAENGMTRSWLDSYIKQINQEQSIQGKQWILAQVQEIKNGLSK